MPNLNPNARRVVLVVDDEADLRELLSEILASAGYDVVNAIDGRDALDTLERVSSPCCIVLDLMMPRMNGWTFLEELARTAYKDTPVVVVTAGVHAPANRPVLKKPFVAADLVKLVDENCRS